MRDALVGVVPSAAGEPRLAAWIVAPSAAAPEAAELRAFLAGSLPEHMIPAAYVRLDAFPLTVNGKLDLKALPNPGQPHSPHHVAPPETPAQEVMAEIWREVLGIPAIGIDDNFFAVGGDSILSLQIVAKARKRGFSLTPRQIFELQTIRRLAEAAGNPVRAAAAAEGGPAELPLTPIQAWFFGLDLARPSYWTQIAALELPASIGADRSGAALTAVAGLHDALRLRFERDETGEWHQRLSAGPAMPGVETHDLSGLSPTERDMHLKKLVVLMQERIDITAGPLVRAGWFELGGDTALLIVAAHHLVVDGVSWRVLLSDFADAIAGSLPLSPPASFADWGMAVAEAATAADLRAEVDIWRALNRETPLSLPADRAVRPAEDTAAGTRVVTLTFDTAETEALLRLAPSVRFQPGDLMLAALARAVTTAGSEGGLPVALESHGRVELEGTPDLSRTVGWFTALYPVALPIDRDIDDWALALAVKARLRAVPRQGIGWGLLRHGPDREIRDALAHLPTPGISFNYLGRFTDTAGDWRLRTDLDLPAQAPENLRPFALELVALVAEGRLTVRWLYNEARHDAGTVEGWSRRFAATLRHLLARCRAGDRADLPADFPLAVLDARELGGVLAAAPSAVDDIYPLSPLQQGMLFHTLESPRDGLYVEQITGTLTGDLDEGRFEAAWNEVIARHGVLRSIFLWEGLREPHQAVLGAAAMPLYRHDWRGLDPAESEARFQALLARDRELGLALDRAPLMRFTFVRTGEETHRWIWTHHHILLDGWSLPVIFGEVLAAYEAKGGGEAGARHAVRPYRDHIARLRLRPSDADFWRSALAGITAPCRLDMSGDPGDEGRPGETDLQISTALAERLEALARGERVTLNTVMQGAWALLLERLGCGRTVTFGVTVSGRPGDMDGVETMIGLFINTLPFAVHVENAVSLGDWLRALQARQAEMQEHDGERLADIQRWLGLHGDEPLFDTLFVFENYPVAAALGRSAGGIAIGDIRFRERTNYPLTLAVIPGTRPILRLNYDGRRFGRGQAERLLGWLERLLAAMAARPDGTLGLLTPLSAEERESVLRTWTRRRIQAAVPLPAHRLVERQADLRPQAIALASASGSLTYADLDAAANRLAHRLMEAGAGPETVVGVMLPRSADFVTAILAVLKAGGAWLPLDGTYPADRLRHMLEDSRAVLLLNRGPLPETMDWCALPRMDIAAGVPADATRPAVAVDPANLAYVIYTSGSTGRPKGVMVSHGGLANLAFAQAAGFGIGPGDREFQFASISFDASVAEIFSALAVGATLCLPPDGAAPDPLDGIRQAAALGTTHITLPPSLAAALSPADLPDLRTLVLAGEAAPGELFRRWSTHARVVNAYGPTEATVCAAIEDCTGLAGEPAIGHAMAGCALYLLDARGEPVPENVPGEIHIAGAGLARGYQGRPDLTAAAFLPDPFAGTPGERMYRTGDFGMYGSDGRIRYLGRRDHQVKLRGFRIELVEIEAVLNRHPAVAASAALVVSSAAGRQELTAAVVRRAGKDAMPDALRGFAAAVLPTHMVPQSIRLLDALPVTPNGKVDRKALAAVMTPEDRPSGGTAEHATETESLMAAIWSEAFNGMPIGPDDNFFALGGDSILSLQIVSRARAAGLDITPRQIFDHQTVAALAAAAGRVLPTAHAAEPEQAEIPLTPVQHWFLAHDWPAPHHWNQSLAFALDADIDAAVLERALAVVHGRHDALRLRFSPGKAGWRQFYDGPGTPPGLRRFDLSALPMPEQAEALARHADAVQAGMDLAAGRTFAAALFERGPFQPRLLLLAAHHLVIDAVSWRVLLADLHAAYRRAAGGHVLPPPAAASPYRLWAEHLAAEAAGGRWAEEAGAWLAIVAPPAVTLPMDHIPPAGDRVDEEAAVGASLSPGHTQALLRGAEGSRVLEPLLAALAVTMAEWCGDHGALVFDMEGHGRAEPAPGLIVTDTVGWFTAIHPVRLALEGAADPAGALQAARHALDGIPGAGLGWGVLRYLAPDPALARRLGEAPARTLCFNYLGQTDGAAMAFGGFTPLSVPLGAERDGRQGRPHPLALTARVEDGRFLMVWQFDRRRFRPATVERLATAYVAALETMIDHAAGREEGVPAQRGSGRFSHVDLDATAFDALLSDLDIGADDR